REILHELRPHLKAGTPVVVLEPSCLAVFRDELLNLFPDDADAQRLSRQSFLLADFLRKHRPEYTPPQLPQRILAHGHCHHKAVAGMDHEKALLNEMAPHVDVLDSGCGGIDRRRSGGSLHALAPMVEPMKTALLDRRDGLRTFVVVCETGDEVMKVLTAFASEQGLGGSRFTAIGAFSRAVVAYFDWSSK